MILRQKPKKDTQNIFENLYKGFGILGNCVLFLSSTMANVGGIINYKNRLQEYTMKKPLPLPVYETLTEGLDHFPRFRKVSDYQFEETIGKGLLSELLVRVGMSQVPPMFSTTMTGAAHSPTFTSMVEINGVSYVGGKTKSKREAEAKAAFEAFQAIKTELGESTSEPQIRVQSDRINALKQPNQYSKDARSETKATMLHGYSYPTP
ncbi:hypothetical protein SUGI_0886260 [Cryptomeria japonica]|nr:hypothetical protein SUGI_0886260 [Cryptomeria japonica]